MSKAGMFKRFYILFILLIIGIDSGFATTLIAYGNKASVVEINVAKDLASDIKRVFPKEVVEILEYSQNLTLQNFAHQIVIGNPTSNPAIQNFLINASVSGFKSETFILKTNNNILYIAGADDRRTYYGVYEFSEKVLRIDPLAYWTIKYFGNEASETTIKSLKKTHLANQPLGGFRQIMDKTVTILNQLKADQPIIQSTDSIMKAFILALDATKLAEEAFKKVKVKERNIFDDQVLFPTRIFELNIALLLDVALFNNDVAKANQKAIKKLGIKLQRSLSRLRKTLNKGSQWKDWYNCDHFRVYTPPPIPIEMEVIIAKCTLTENK